MLRGGLGRVEDSVFECRSFDLCSVFSQEMASAFAQTTVNKHLALSLCRRPCNLMVKEEATVFRVWHFKSHDSACRSSCSCMTDELMIVHGEYLQLENPHVCSSAIGRMFRRSRCKARATWLKIAWQIGRRQLGVNWSAFRRRAEKRLKEGSKSSCCNQEPIITVFFPIEATFFDHVNSVSHI